MTAKELRNLVYSLMEFEDYSEFFRMFSEKNFAGMIRISGEYLDRARTNFFASLDKEYCDVEKAKLFHDCYKVYDLCLNLISSEMSRDINVISEEVDYD